MVKFRVLKWQDIDLLARKCYHLAKSDNFWPDIIIGISRGGWIPARLLSDMFEAEYHVNRPQKSLLLATMQIKFYAAIAERHTRPVIAQDVGVDIYNKKILLVDDLADTGDSLRTALDYLDLKSPEEVRIATLLFKPWSKIKPNYFAEQVTEWVIFPHEYYEFMTERTISEKYNRTTAWATFIELGIPDSSVIFFVENFF
ncbi:MAG: phosphoribosyltransferase [Candidatus Hodarchaeales archaeon]